MSFQLDPLHIREPFGHKCKKAGLNRRAQKPHNLSQTKKKKREKSRYNFV